MIIGSSQESFASGAGRMLSRRFWFHTDFDAREDGRAHILDDDDHQLMTTSKIPILQTAAASDHENEDRGALVQCGSKNVLVVADGAGGISGGAAAAECAVEFIRAHAESITDPNSCVSILQNMDAAVAQKPNAGETTCAFAVIAAENIFGGSVGDSGVWIISKCGFMDLTDRQVRKPLIGSGDVRPVPFSAPRGSGEYLLLGTDGLFKYSPSQKIVAVCRDSVPAIAAHKLIELVRYPSGALPDDVTVILARL